MLKISVIIPYYNDPLEYVKQCLTSVLSQEDVDFEVIIVNDGSTAENSEALELEAGRDSRVRVIQRDNQGVSVARNRGVLEAKGEYLAFADADDLLLPGFLKAMLTAAEDGQADIVYSLAVHTDDEGAVPSRSIAPVAEKADDEWLNKYTVGELYKEGNMIFGRGPWARLIRRELAASIPFAAGVPIGEDVVWNLEVIRKARRKLIIRRAGYLYMIRGSSVTMKYNPAINDWLQPFYRHIVKYVEDGSLKPLYYHQRIFRDLKRYIFRVHYGHSANPDSFLKKWKGFDQTLRTQPWAQIASPDYWKQAGNKEKFRILAVKMRLIYPIWRLGGK